MNKYIVAILVLILAIGGTAWWVNKPVPDDTVVRIGYLPAVHALPLFLALEEGYFEAAGVKVEVTKFEAPNQIIDALLSKQLDVALAAATGITAVAESKNPGSMKVFAVTGGDDDHDSEALLVHKDSSITSITQLKGKKVGILPGIQWRTIARNLFAQNGIDIDKDLTIVELAIPLQGQALMTKQVDALLAIEPVTTVANSLGASKVLALSPNLTYISNPFYPGTGNISVSFMTNHPDLSKKVVKVLAEANAEVNEGTEEARAYLVGYTPLTLELAKVVSLPSYKMVADLNQKDKEAIQKFIDIFVRYGVIERPLKADNILYQ